MKIKLNITFIILLISFLFSGCIGGEKEDEFSNLEELGFNYFRDKDSVYYDVPLLK